MEQPEVKTPELPATPPIFSAGLWCLIDWHEFSLLVNGDEEALHKLEEEAEKGGCAAGETQE